MLPVNDALSVLFALRLEDGRRWREAATDWQLEDAEAVLGDGEERLHWFGRPKGGSKSTDLAAFSIVWLVTEAPALAEGFAVASDEEQANRLLDRARGLVARTPELQGRVKVEARRIIGPNGARVQALAADVAGSEGLLTPWVVLDEVPNWTSTASARAMWTSIVSAIPKWKGMRLIVIGHAGDPGHWSYRELEGARESPAWNVHEVPGPLEWMSEADLIEQQRLLLPSEYARRHLNIWTSSEDRLTNVDDLAACVTLDGPRDRERGRRYAMSLDIGLKNDRTVAAVMSREVIDGSEIVALDRMGVWQGSRAAPVSIGAVEAWLLVAWREFGQPSLVADPYQAAQLGQRLRARGVHVIEFPFTSTSVSKLALRLYQLIRDHALALPNDAELLEELMNVRLRETSPGVYRLDHESGRHDDRAIALALGAQHLTGKSPGPGFESYPGAKWGSVGSDLRWEIPGGSVL